MPSLPARTPACASNIIHELNDTKQASAMMTETIGAAHEPINLPTTNEKGALEFATMVFGYIPEMAVQDKI